MARIVSFLALVGFILIFAALFYRVIAPFLLPLFVAGVLALLFNPWYQWITARLRGRRRIAAGITTVTVVLIVLVPLGGILAMATYQLLTLVPPTLLRPRVVLTNHGVETSVPLTTGLLHSEPAPGPADSEESSGRDEDERRSDNPSQTKDPTEPDKNAADGRSAPERHVPEGQSGASGGDSEKVQPAVQPIEPAASVAGPAPGEGPSQGAQEQRSGKMDANSAVPKGPEPGRTQTEGGAKEEKTHAEVAQQETEKDGKDEAGRAAQEKPPAQPSALRARLESLADSILDRLERIAPLDRADARNRLNAAYQAVLADMIRRTPGLLGDLFSTVLGMIITVVALYFFLVDGPAMLETVLRLSPLEDRYKRQLLDQFDSVCRAVVFGTLASAMVQGVLALAGFLLVNLYGWEFLLALLTVLTAMIPFMGAAFVWVPVAFYLVWEGPWWRPVFMFLYGTLVVSLIDNVIKPYVLHGRAQLHPLLALLSVLGGVNALGLWGIFIGPMVAAFLYALLNILHQELRAFRESEGRGGNATGHPAPPSSPAPVSQPSPPATRPEPASGTSAVHLQSTGGTPLPPSPKE